MKILPAEFDGQSIRRVYDEDTETWWFSVVDVVQVLTQQSDDLTARKYWNQLKRRLANEAWLKRVPDDPGALLRARFQLEAQRRRGGQP